MAGMRITLAFAGLRHGHIFAMLSHAQSHPDIEVVAVCEEDTTAREEIVEAGKAHVTHTNIDQMLDEVECDAIAIGDYYGNRGSIAIRALEAGKHVIGDKPLCTRLDELERIQELSEEKNLKVGCMFTMRDGARYLGVRDLLQNDEIGEIHAISSGGQHPLMLDSRPSWYFEPGRHGGTINDVGCHAVDIIPWLTDLEFTTVNSARCWNAFAKDFPHFEDAGQMMLTMNNGCGVLGDVSYFLPDSFGYSNPLYWRMTFFGRKGIIETSATAKSTLLMRDGDKVAQDVSLPEAKPMGYLKAFIDDINDLSGDGELSTVQVLKATRNTLTIQRAADQGQTNVEL